MMKRTIFSSVLGLALVISVTSNLFLLSEFETRLVDIESNNIELKNMSDDVSSLDYSTTEIAEIASLSVVGIEVEYETSVRWGRQYQTITQKTSGSGIVYSEDGYILTNYHVLTNAINSKSYQLKVYFSDGYTYDAKYVDGDEMNDLALIKVDKTDCVPAMFGDSNELKLGEFAMAIGYPLGTDLAGSVTVGVISGVNRDISDSDYAYIQTDASINPGNSGGALVNSNAQVIGVNTSKISSTEVEGIGFAIPINEVLSIVDSFLN